MPVVVAYTCVCAHTVLCVLGLVFFAVKVIKMIAALVRAQVYSGTQGSEGEEMFNLQPGVLSDDFFFFLFLIRDREPLFSNFFLTEKSIIFPDMKASETG